MKEHKTTTVEQYDDNNNLTSKTIYETWDYGGGWGSGSIKQARIPSNSEETKQHVKTYKEDFFEKCPNAQKDEDGYPVAYQTSLYLIKTHKGIFNTEDFKQSWDRPCGYFES